MDLRKAEDRGLTVETLAEEIRATGVIRRSVFLAEYYLERGECFSDAAFLMPGDLVFFRSSGFFSDRERNYQGKPEINHVGLVSNEPGMMIHSSGSYNKKGGQLQAVSMAPIFDLREPAFFCRPAYDLNR